MGTTRAASNLGLFVRNTVFTFIVPATGAVYVPWWILTSGGRTPRPVFWPAVGIIAAGIALYLWCLWHFATTGRGTPGPWDPPRRFVAVGPYRFVRNPMYISAAMVIGGEALLFVSVPLAVYLVVVFVAVHVFVIAYEEPTLRGQFGADYESYRRTVRRWIPSRPERAERT
jgi:protein-S-isoprenylcysteine O-methyltransferase Ste14